MVSTMHVTRLVLWVGSTDLSLSAKIECGGYTPLAFFEPMHGIPKKSPSLFTADTNS